MPHLHGEPLCRATRVPGFSLVRLCWIAFGVERTAGSQEVGARSEKSREAGFCLTETGCRKHLNQG